MSLQKLPERMRQCVRVDDDGPGYNGTPCWLWTGELNRNGYGTFRIIPEPGKRKRKMAHIEAYVAVCGDYDRSLLLDHKCRVRHRCNPHHLEPVAPLENTLRGDAVLFQAVAS